MGSQNRDHIVNGHEESGAIGRHLARKSFTTGCPVRKAPKSQIEKGNSKSGIALLSDYLGEQLRVAAETHFNEENLAAVAASEAALADMWT